MIRKVKWLHAYKLNQVIIFILTIFFIVIASIQVEVEPF